ncbi:MAG TPA: PAS domain-containing sensor histidine kinase, partial [Opitutaceae bacterium]|nr:PAS domain-containing sensor histidine kinase [Opitutaceae bacterium]
MATRHRRFTHDQQVLFYTLLAGAPAVAVALWYVWSGDDPKVQWTLSLLIVGFWLGFATSVRHRVVRPLQTVSNLLSALREGDFSIRARGARRDEPLGDVQAEINILGDVLQAQRLGALEATA